MMKSILIVFRFFLWLDLAFLMILFLLGAPHFIFGFCPIKWRFIGDLDIIPICYCMPSFEGLRDQQQGLIVFAPEGSPSPFSATCKWCRFFPARMIPFNLDFTMPDTEFYLRLKAMHLSAKDIKLIYQKKAALVKSDDSYTCIARFRGFILLGTNHHGLLAYDPRAHHFFSINGSLTEGHLGEAIKSIAPTGKEFLIEHDYRTPTYFATSVCRINNETLTCRRIK